MLQLSDHSERTKDQTLASFWLIVSMCQTLFGYNFYNKENISTLDFQLRSFGYHSQLHFDTKARMLNHMNSFRELEQKYGG